jgi:hypothetical protein
MTPDDTESGPLRFLRLTLSIAAMRLDRNSAWLVAALFFAAAVLPFLVYYTGTLTLGPYANGGPMRFVRDFYVDLVRMRAAAWALLLGPVALVVVWRLLVAYAWHETSE